MGTFELKTHIDPEGAYFWDKDKKKFTGRGTKGPIAIPQYGYAGSGRGATGVFSPRARAERIARRQSNKDRLLKTQEETANLHKAQADKIHAMLEIYKEFGPQLIQSRLEEMAANKKIISKEFGLDEQVVEPATPRTSVISAEDSGIAAPAPAPPATLDSGKKPYDARKSWAWKYGGMEGLERMFNVGKKEFFDTPLEIGEWLLEQLTRER